MKFGLTEVKVLQRQKVALVLAALIAAAGHLWRVHDGITLALLVGAAGLISSSRERKAWILAAVMVAGGLGWSRIDQSGGSAWWRASVVYEKLRGRLPYVEWNDVQRKAFGPCCGSEVEKSVYQVEEKVVEGRKWELYQTELGKFWLTAPGKELLTFLVWEMTVQRIYESGEVAIRPGDTVVDCGANVGLFTKLALKQGADRVVAIEPDPANVACLESNLGPEIAEGRVVVVKAGLWNKKTRLTFYESLDGNSGKHTFVLELPNANKIEGLPVLPLDDIVANLKLDRVDFIKMDIEGSERFAIQGATGTLRRFKPRMAICAYHSPGDPTIIPALVKRARPDYQIHAKDILNSGRKVHTKVLFFD